MVWGILRIKSFANLLDFVITTLYIRIYNYKSIKYENKNSYFIIILIFLDIV